MPSPESAPAFQRPEVVEKKRTTRERFVTVPTHIPGVSLRAEPGVEVDILKKTIEELASLARDHASRYFQIGELQIQQKASDKDLKTSVQTHEGLRGVQSEEDNFVVSVFPRDSVSWDHQLLKKSAGIAYSTIAHEDLVFTISVPVGFQTERGPIEEEMLRQVLFQALVSLGLSEDDLRKIMDAKVSLRVDEKSLEEMIKAGKVSLLAGTKQTERTWAITVDHLKKSPES